MDDEKLKKANQLSEEIKDLKNHLRSVNRKNPETGEVDGYVIRGFNASITNGRYNDSFSLWPEFYNKDEFLMVYEARLQAKINQLQKEFDQL